MRLFVYVVLVLALFSSALCASPVTLEVRGLTGGGYVLTQKLPDSEVSFTSFCLDKSLAQPTSAQFDIVAANTVSIDPALMVRAAWISRQSGTMEDRQAAIWSVMGAQVALSTSAQQLVLNSQGQSFDLSMLQVLAPTSSQHQRYLVSGIASSTAAAETPEPATLLMLGAGLSLIARRMRPKVL